MALYVPDSESLGRRRFPDNKGFRKNLYDLSIQYLAQIRDLLASNYPQDTSTNLAIFNRVASREFARLKLSNDAINNDKQYTETRIQYLQQILGERLFLGDEIAPANYNDESYRKYLIAIKKAYLKGSKKRHIEDLASEFTGQTVNIKELYLEARNPTSSLDVSDTNMMVIEVFIEDFLRAGYNINELRQDLDFFVNLVRPAHVLYDTRLIWTEQIDVNKVHDVIFGDTGGGCVPHYIFGPFEELTILALQVFILPTSEDSTGQIDSIHHEDLIFYLSDSTRVITEPGVLSGTRIYNVEGRRINFNALKIGQYVKITSQIIPGNFDFWWYPSKLITTWSSQFYKNVYRRPLFQEFVKKEMDSHGRFPLQTKTTPTTVCDRWVQDTLQPLYEDLRRSCSVGSEHEEEYLVTLRNRMGNPRFSNPYGTDQTAIPGNDFAYWMPNTPLTDGSNNPATPSDISVKLDGTSLPTQPIVYVDSSSGKIQLSESSIYWDQTAQTFPVPGSELLFSYHYLQDSTNYDTSSSMVYGVSNWQMPYAPLVRGDGTGNLAGTSNISLSVDSTTITNAVTDVNPLLGHVSLPQSSDFWTSSELGRLPQVGDVFDFDFYWGQKYQYSCLFDELGRILDGYIGPHLTYGIVLDGDLDCNPEINPVTPMDSTTVIGYRYRGYLLHHTSVLNSPDTLNLNDFQKPATRASIVNQENAVNHYNIFFSPEFLDDTRINIILDDNYLTNGLDPILELNEGTPPFQKTFSYQPSLIKSRKLQDIRTNHCLLLYSDLLLKEFRSDGGVPLSSLCDSERFTFEIGLGEDTIPKIEECPPWILFDTVELEDETVDIPGDYRGVPNLRVVGKYLRSNFILRETEPTGSAVFIYQFTTLLPGTEFYLPSSFKYTYNDILINFPTLPVITINGSLATKDDIEATVDGVSKTVNDLNPTTGWVQMVTSVPAGSDVVFTYRIRSSQIITMVDRDHSRILDNDDVFPGYCFDGEDVSLNVPFDEFFTFLDDQSDGIKLSFFNKDTLAVEEHIFSGPVFEYYNVSEDEIGSPDNFPNALVKINNPTSSDNPLNYMADYGFLNDKVVRFRKKTYKELLPTRTFRTIELIEMMSV